MAVDLYACMVMSVWISGQVGCYADQRKQSLKKELTLASNLANCFMEKKQQAMQCPIPKKMPISSGAPRHRHPLDCSHSNIILQHHKQTTPTTSHPPPYNPKAHPHCLPTTVDFVRFVMKYHQKQEKQPSALAKSERQIQFMLRERQQLVQQLQRELDGGETSLAASFVGSVSRRVEQYGGIAGIVESITAAPAKERSRQLNGKFWHLNETIEREVEDRLRQLKEADQRIDSILNDEYALCDEVERVDEAIRNALGRQDPNPLARAEPLLAAKTQALEKLQMLKQQKERGKEGKLATIRELLQLLERLKAHREDRLGHCREKRLTGDSLGALNGLVRDLREVMSQREKHSRNCSQRSKLQQALTSASERIRKVENELLSLFTEQEESLAGLGRLQAENEEFEYFESRLFEQLRIQPHALGQFLERSAEFIAEEQERKKESEQLLQGIATTAETLSIFRHVQQAIENENRRKLELLTKLEILQREHAEQTTAEERISDLEAELEKGELKLHRLRKKLSTKADQADVTAYRSVSQEMEEVEMDCRAKRVIILDMRKEWSERAKQLYQATTAINDDFADILSEVVPQAWFRDHDFAKEETIKDLNLYLLKTFHRLTAKE